MESNQVPEIFNDQNLEVSNIDTNEVFLGDMGIIKPQCGCNKEISSKNMEGEGNCSCSGGSTPPTYVFAIGEIEFRYPSISVANWIRQEVKNQSANTSGKTDDEVLYQVLKENPYLIRELCWVFTIAGVDTYLILPRNPAEYDLLLDSILPKPIEKVNIPDVNVVIGIKGPLAPPEMCNGLILPIVGVDQIFSFDIDSFFEQLSTKETINSDHSVFYRISQITDNTGSLDEHRALNFLSVRYKPLYSKVAEMYGENYSFTGVEVRPSRLSVGRKLVDVILTFTNRQSEFKEKWFVRVDVTQKFPFVHSDLAQYFEII
ncbi:hypothetical protein [Bacillus thuringiensis]|uniref:cyanobactin maturation protease PatG family protein n=1 Tax=Bacillus thuringiensis TaxID=1428 RepID=UPI001CEF6536|nr:hypothetical protein [Bacillus thuringiensis]